MDKPQDIRRDVLDLLGVMAAVSVTGACAVWMFGELKDPIKREEVGHSGADQQEEEEEDGGVLHCWEGNNTT